MDKITFIIPTIGRSTLLNSVNSLLNQTIEDWNAIIIFDGVEQNFFISDERIKIIKINKIGKNINSAGNVRNYGMNLVDTKWIAFLDDDDIIADDYIECFYNEIKYAKEYKNEDIDVLIFRMRRDNDYIPNLDVDNFYICDVGISFIIKKTIYDDEIKFIPDGAEDYLYLDTIRKNGYTIMISPFIKYFVRETEYNMDDNVNKNNGSRVIINNNDNNSDFNSFDSFDNDNQSNKINSFLVFMGYYFYMKERTINNLCTKI